MARGARYRVPFRRRREGKTNYRLRRKLILSKLPRVVVRGSLNNITVQLIEPSFGGDKVLFSAHSRELMKKYGWKGHCGNLPAAYLTGLLLALKAKGKVKRAVLDIGLHTPVRGSRVFAALKGVLDGGLDVPHGEEILPSEERISGGHIAKYARYLLELDPTIYARQFSAQIKRGVRPEDMPKHFNEVKKAILEDLGGKR
ncbi:MAG: 50S ribosomal protein L18 [Candidatus Freyarchaeota archaeon]|nr:50S ribosomal protein L18 [Candidatus Freyrarchaeum guaymaensis]